MHYLLLMCQATSQDMILLLSAIIDIIGVIDEMLNQFLKDLLNPLKCQAISRPPLNERSQLNHWT